MMSRHKLKPVIQILCILLALSLTACGTGTPASPEVSSSTAASASTSAASESASASAESALAHDPITITGAIFMEPIESSTIKTDPVSKYI